MVAEVKSKQVDNVSSLSETKSLTSQAYSIKTTTTITATIKTTAKGFTNDDLTALSKSLNQRHINFKPRGSHFDRETMDQEQSTFRGFFTLFWIAMGFYIIQTVVHNLESAGTLFDLSFAKLFSSDAIVLILSDACMVGATFFDVLLQKVVARGWIKWRYTGMILQHVFQISFLFISVCWTFYRGWPWVQSGFFVLHTISMLMKIHSYAFYNGDLSSLALRVSNLKEEYNQIIGRNKKSDSEPTSIGNDDSKKSAEVTRNVADLRQEIQDIENCLISTSGKISYPDNLSFTKFADYLFIPTLVYEFEYPRTTKIRPWYVFEKALATLGTFFLLYVNTETYIIPVIPRATESFAKAFFQMSLPFMVNYLLIFYIIFECICNLFAELSCFADRNFYDDWWNSATFDEYARKWNKPVHHFLLRHVYQSSIQSYKLSKRDASFMTFFLSSLVHELVMIVVARKIRMYLFFLQMLQLPLIWIGQMPAIKQRKWLGNAFFWFGMFSGPPLLGILYCCEINVPLY
ncbi:hypothetical protein G9A89_021602 [Geosiphon pyriformis]|nr:hypothetical protein G9A89_021602 [Geosiphon pyriformis]